MNKRKQKLEVKSDELLCGDMLPTETPPSWFLDSDTSFDFSHTVFDDFLDLLDMPLATFEDPLENESKEVFQDLQYTSTPKTRLPHTSNDSGFENSPKRYRTESSSSSVVLNDISNNIIELNNSFTEQSKQSSLTNDLVDEPYKRRIGILRKSIVAKPLSKDRKKDVNIISKEQMVYYTGIKDYNKAVALLKHMKLPKKSISSFKMQLMTLMKLRLDLEWKDISYRFSLPQSAVMDIVQTTVQSMSLSLEELLPWNAKKKIHRKKSKIFYIHILKNGELSQVMLVLSETKDTILFVSESYGSISSALMIFLNHCNDNIIVGDIICVPDESGDYHQLYRVENMVDGKGVVLIDPNMVFDSYYFVKLCTETIEKILKEFIVLSKPLRFFDISNLTKIAGALTNLNQMNDINFVQLKIFERNSSHLPK